jgi:transposase
VTAEISKRKLEGFVTTELHEYTTKNETFQKRKNNPYPSQGYMRKIRSFQVMVKENNRNPLDGVFALITSPGSDQTPEEMMTAYRQKYLIESAFREMKSVLKLRPWFVYKMEHVRAHYTICVLAYALERLLDLLLEQHGAKADGWTLLKLKEELSRYRLIEISIGDQHKRKTLQRVPEELRILLKRLGLEKCLKLP